MMHLADNLTRTLNRSSETLPDADFVRSYSQANAGPEFGRFAPGRSQHAVPPFSPERSILWPA